MYYLYSITNTVNNKRYIGITHNLKNRFYEHQYKLRNGKHHSKKLQRAWDKYGESSFSFSVLDTIEGDFLEASQAEVKTIEKYNSYYNGYNETLGGDGQNKYDYDEIVDFYLNNNYSIMETCIHFGIYDQVVYNALKNNGIDYKNLKNKKEKKKFNKKILLVEKDLVFERITQIDNYLGKKMAHGNIRRCLNGITKMAYGYHWKELEEGEEDGKNIYHE